MMYCGAHTGISADDANNLSGYFDFSRRFNLRHTFRLSSGAAFFATPDEVRFRVRSFSIYFSFFHRRLAFLPSLERTWYIFRNTQQGADANTIRGFSPTWKIRYEKNTILAQSRSTSESVTSSDTFLVVLKRAMIIIYYYALPRE